MEKHLTSPSYVKEVTYNAMVDGVMTEITTNLLMVPAIVEAIPENVRKNSNGKEFRVITVRVNDPVEGVVTGNAQLWENSLAEYGDIFTKGGEIELAVQTEGKYINWAKAQLPAPRHISVANFMTKMKTAGAPVTLGV